MQAVIAAVHTLVYADDADAARAFFRDVLGWDGVSSGPPDEGWLVFKTGPSELGVPPTGGVSGEAAWSTPQHHEITLMCENLEATVAGLRAKGAEFTRDIRGDGFGLTTSMRVPGAGEMMVYQPRHEPAYDLP